MSLLNPLYTLCSKERFSSLGTIPMIYFKEIDSNAFTGVIVSVSAREDWKAGCW